METFYFDSGCCLRGKRGLVPPLPAPPAAAPEAAFPDEGVAKINHSVIGKYAIGPCSAFANRKIKNWWLVVAYYKGATNTVAPWPVPVRRSLRNLQMRKPFTAAFASEE